MLAVNAFLFRLHFRSVLSFVPHFEPPLHFTFSSCILLCTPQQKEHSFHSTGSIPGVFPLLFSFAFQWYLFSPCVEFTPIRKKISTEFPHHPSVVPETKHIAFIISACFRSMHSIPFHLHSVPVFRTSKPALYSAFIPYIHHSTALAPVKLHHYAGCIYYVLPLLLSTFSCGMFSFRRRIHPILLQFPFFLNITHNLFLYFTPCFNPIFTYPFIYFCFIKIQFFSSFIMRYSFS